MFFLKMCRSFGLLLVAAIMAGETALATGITIHDARGRDVTVENSARIVSIGGAITEILYALGFEDRLAGVDATSLFPPAALRDKPNVGYWRQLSAEGVLGLNPSLVLAMQGSGPKETIEVLEAAKVPLVMVPEVFFEQGLLDKIALVGRALNAGPRAACLTRAVTEDLAKLNELRRKVTKPVRVMFVMSFVNGRALAAGRNTAADEIVRLAGAVNAIDGYEGYKPVNDEAIIAAAPDVVLSIARGKESVEADAVFAHPAFTLTPAAAGKAFISMEGLYLLGFGPRTAAAARDLAVQLYPALAPQAEKFAPAAFSADCRR